MKKICYSMFLVCIYTLSATTQNSLQKQIIYGTLIDHTTQKPVSEATIRILQQKDSMFVTGTVSKIDGSFSISLKEQGPFIVHISFVGYADIFKNVQFIRNTPVNLDTISLHENQILLKETVITAQAPEIIIKGDTLEYNADSYKITETAVVEDLLKKMSGVEVDSDGKITVNGKEIKKILVDGKEFFSDDPKIASKNLPAKMIDKLQVLDKKSEMEKMTGFDDGNEEMVINLTVKPAIKQSIFGNAFAGYGSKNRYEANAITNYMRNSDQLTFIGGYNNTNNAGASDLASAMFGNMGGRSGRGMRSGGNSGTGTSGNAGLNFGKEFSQNLELGGNVRFGDMRKNLISKVYTQNLLSKGNTFEDEDNRTVNGNNNVNMDIRMEWKPDTLTNIVLRPNISINHNTREEQGVFLTTRENGDTINYGNSTYKARGKGKNIGLSLYASRKLNNRGRNISVNINTGNNDSENHAMNISNTHYNGTRPDDLIDQRVTNTNTSGNWNANISYVEPFGKSTFLQLSYNYRQNKSNNDKDTRTKDEQGNYTVFDRKYSKKNENNVSNQSLSVNFRSRMEKYNYVIGFNVHPQTSKRKTFIGDSIINDFAQHITNYSPNAQFNYNWTRQKNLHINYSGSTDQPNVNQLSPVVDVSDPLNISYGNPDLKPSFRHNIDIRFQNSKPEKNRFFMLNGGINYVTNAIVSSRFTDEKTGQKESTFRNVNGNWNSDLRFMTRQPFRNPKFTATSVSTIRLGKDKGYSNNEENLSRQINLSENLNLHYNSEKFDFYVRGNIAYNRVTNTLEGKQDREYFNYGSSANTTIYLPHDINFQSDIRYATNSGYSDGFKQNEVLWNASVEKQFFKKKNALIRFKIYDILQQQSNIRRNISSNFIRDVTTNTLTSYFIIHFVYRFNWFNAAAPEKSNSGRQRKGR